MLVELEEFLDQVRKAAKAAEAVSSADRYELFKAADPYPRIRPSLLHSGYIASYAIAAGVIDPLEFERDLTKPATYLVPLEGKCRYRDNKNEKKRFYLSASTAARAHQLDEVRSEVELAPNSICYVTLKPHFRIPYYLACRFNLKITEVYRGLLVGTGPLVDPGFDGQLSIPIHNLTDQTYVLKAGAGLVYFEFTKLEWSGAKAAQPEWLSVPISCHPPFPESKLRRRDLDDYLRDANPGGPPQNALMLDIEKVKELSADTKSRLNLFSWVGALAALGLLVTGAGVIISAYTYVQSAENALIDFNQRVNAELSERAREAAQPVPPGPTSAQPNASTPNAAHRSNASPKIG
jgi:deoxycytidine triphosphate deaminase